MGTDVTTTILIPTRVINYPPVKAALEHYFTEPTSYDGPVVVFSRKLSDPDIFILTDCLLKQGIPFDLENEHDYEFQATRRYFRPAFKDDPEYDQKIQLDVCGDPIIKVSDIKLAVQVKPERLLEYLNDLIQQNDPNVPDLKTWIKQWDWKVKDDSGNTKKGCPLCGNQEFTAKQLCYMDVVVDTNNSFIRNIECSDSERPYGPYSCTRCGHEMAELPKEQE